MQIYVMRIRHIIMKCYFPERGRERAAWLRTNIRNRRGLFHRMVHSIRTLDMDPNARSSNVTCFGRMLLRHVWLRRCLSLIGIKRVMCAFCGEQGNPKKKVKFKERFTQCTECGAFFCKVCQVDLENICAICQTPLFAMALEVDYEKCSSEEEYESMCTHYLRKAETAPSVVNRDPQETQTMSAVRQT